MNPSDILSNPAAIASIVVVALLLFVFMPFMLMRAAKQSRIARNYLPDLLRLSGLQTSPDSSFIFGNFKGFPTVLKFGVGRHVSFSTDHGDVVWSGGGRHRHNAKMKVYQKFTIEMDLPKMIADFALIEKPGYLRTDKSVNTQLSEISTSARLKRVTLFGSDQNLANKLVNDSELANMFDKWHFTDIRITGNKLTFIMDDYMTASKFGSRIGSPQFVVDGLEISTRVAKIATS